MEAVAGQPSSKQKQARKSKAKIAVEQARRNYTSSEDEVQNCTRDIQNQNDNRTTDKHRIEEEIQNIERNEVLEEQPDFENHPDYVTVTVNRDEEAELLSEEGEILSEENTSEDSEDLEVTFRNPSVVTGIEQLSEANLNNYNYKGRGFLCSKESDFDAWRGNQAFDRYIQKRVAEGSKQPEMIRKQPVSVVVKTTKPKQPVQPRDYDGPSTSKGMNRNETVGNNNCIDRVKSPSDTTIYAPALQKSPIGNGGLSIAGNAIAGITQQPSSPFAINAAGDNLMNNEINVDNFIQGIQRQSDVQRRSMGCERERIEDNFADNLQDAKDRASQMVLEVEKFKAAVNTPPGNYSHDELNKVNHCNAFNLAPQGVLNNGVNGPVKAGPRLDDDDEFFHVLCHVDTSLKEKIQHGDFVDLDKLFPKLRNRPGLGSDQKLDLVFREGKPFFVPAAPKYKITGVRKWEQAFRVYAAIYSEANQTRASEIWQYVHIINVGVASYVRDNVSAYDFTFHQLMAANPHRSWAKIYQQMWSISMHEPLVRSGGGSTYQNYNSNGYGSGAGGPPRNNGNKQKKKIKYCWDYNRSKKCKDGEKCKYVHQCSYCDKADHRKDACPKKNN